MTDFSKKISTLADGYEKRMRAVLRQSVQDTVNDANRSREMGGRMPIDTGFLRASGSAALNEIPKGPSKPESDADNRVSGDSLTLILARWMPGDSVYYGWTAEYARFQESKTGFLRGATEKWSDTVNKNARKAKARGL